MAGEDDYHLARQHFTEVELQFQYLGTPSAKRAVLRDWQR